MSRTFGLYTPCRLSKKRPLQDRDRPGQAPGQNHGDETLANGGLIAKKTGPCSSALPLERVVLRLYSSEIWA